MNDLFRKIGALLILATMLGLTGPVSAAGVTVTLTPSSSSTSPQATVEVRWTRASPTQYVTGTTIVVSITPSITSVSSTSAIDLDQNGITDTLFTASSTSGGTTTITWTVETTTNNVSVFAATTTAFTFPATAQNYSVAVLTSNPVDFGAALFYANGGNLVTVSATVPASLSFSIRNSVDSADTNVCALGTLGLSTTSTCAYRLRIATNASNGFQAQVLADHDFGSGYATFTNVVNDSGSWTAGTETYGISRIFGATQGGRNTTTGAFDQPVAENNPTGFTFNVDPSAVPTSSAQNFIAYGAAFQTGAAPSTTSTSFVEHAAAISAGTPAGFYSQILTYTVTGSF